MTALAGHDNAEVWIKMLVHPPPPLLQWGSDLTTPLLGPVWLMKAV